MKKLLKRKVTWVGLALLALVVGAGVFSACSDKGTEQYRDAPRASSNDEAADVFTMPDGFSNFSAKCDGPNRVYVIFKNDSAYGSIAVAPNDPRCVEAMNAAGGG